MTTAVASSPNSSSRLQSALLMFMLLVGLPAMFYFFGIRGARARRKIARTTSLDDQIQRFESILTGSIEVEFNRAETRLTKDQLEQIARRNGYTYSRRYMYDKYGPWRWVYRRLNEQGI